MPDRYVEEIFTSHSSITGIKYAESVPYSTFGTAGPQDLFLDIYYPDGDTLAERPVIVHSFGGGYLIGWRSQPNIPSMAEMYTKRGFVFVSIDYRLGFNILDLSGTSPVQAVFRGMQDCRAALRFLADSAQVYGLDMDNVILTGSSAGCVSSIIQTYLSESDIPNLQWNVTSLGNPNGTGNSNNNEMEVPIHGIINNWGAILDTSYIDLADDSNDMIPLISFHGDQDNIVPYDQGSPFNYPAFPSVHGSLLIHQRLDNQGIPNELNTFVGMGHQPNLPALVNGWVTDTIITKASAFMYEHVLKPHLSPINGNLSTCIGDTLTYSVDLHADSYYCWDIIGGTIIAQNNNEIQVVWNTTGSLTVTEVNDILAKDISTINVLVYPVPDAGFTTTSLGDGLFTFENTDINGDSFLWSFGDNNNSNAQNTNHQYSSLGDFTVTLSVSNAGCTVTQSSTITSDVCPDANYTSLVIGANASLTNFTNNATSYSWAFGDNNTSNEENPNHIYTNEGIFTITLIASNDFCSDTFYNDYTIDFCPVANFNTQLNEATAQFTNTSINDDIAFWNFGDGNTSSEDTPLHTYDTPGTYIVQLIVYNGGSCSDTLLQTITVEFCSIPFFNYTTNDLLVEFDADLSGFNNFTWNFGDGNTANNINNLTYSYAQAGTYTVTLSATSSSGCDTSYTTTITVTSVGLQEVYDELLTIYPSPVEDKLFVRFNTKGEQNNQITIYNILGKTVFKDENFDLTTQMIDTKKWVSGIYILEIKINEISLIRKFQKK